MKVKQLELLIREKFNENEFEFEIEKNFVLPKKNIPKEKNNREEMQIINDSELDAISEKIINRNKKIYEELAK